MTSRRCTLKSAVHNFGRLEDLNGRMLFVVQLVVLAQRHPGGGLSQLLIVDWSLCRIRSCR